MRSYRVESLDPRYEDASSVDYINADLFMVDDDHVTVTFFEEKEVCGMTPVAMFPFKNIVSIVIEETTEE